MTEKNEVECERGRDENCIISFEKQGDTKEYERK